MSIKLTNINALDWYSMGTTGITWLNGNHDIIFTHGIWLTGMIGDTLIGTTSGWGLDYSPGPIIDGQAAMIVQPEDSNTYRIYHIDQNSGPGDSDYDEWPVHLTIQMDLLKYMDIKLRIWFIMMLIQAMI